MKLERWLGWGCLALIAIMPFHAFLSVWAGHLFGNMALFQSWKEILIVVMILAASIHLCRSPNLAREKLTPLTMLILGYAAFCLLYASFASNSPYAELLAIKANLGFFAVFLLASLVKDKYFKRLGQKILLAGSGIVSGFAILQNTVLPPEFLTRFGYGQATVPASLPYMGVDRFPSTLGGANQLGAFLILPMALTLKLAIRQRKPWQYLLLGVQTLAIFLSYSRSAWLGAIAAAGIVCWLEANRKWRIRLAAGGVAVFVAGVALVTSMGGQSILVRGESDAERIASLDKGSETVLTNPQGLGPGAAGPASFEDEEPLITENYYLQIAIELGLAGLMLFLATQAVWAKQLWQWRGLPGLGGPLLGALAGISIVNLFLHGWADSSTALTYWAMAGLTLGGVKNV